MNRLSACTAIVFASALFVACSGDDDKNNNGTQDSGVPDTGDVTEDAGTPDTGRRDTGTPDTGTVDSGTPDAGEVSPREEGRSCTPDANGGPGDCIDTTLTCVVFTDDFTDPGVTVARCLRACTEDVDCAGSLSGTLCRPALLDQKICVSAEVGEGRHIDMGLAHGAITGCQNGLFGAPRLSLAILFSLEEDQFSCARRCDASNPCTAGSPVCEEEVLNPMAFTSTTGGSGICLTRLATKGARCSQARVNDICDPLVANLVCVNLGLNDAESLPPPEEDLDFGTCVELCTADMPACAATPNGTPPTCTFGLFTSETLGVCSDGCSAFPDNCDYNGSPVAPGGTIRGSSCNQFGDANLCIDVNQTVTATLAMFDFVNAPNPPCTTNASACPDRSSCTQLDQAATQFGCVAGCTTTLSATVSCGGLGYDNVVCQAFGANTTDGACAPGGT